MNHCVVQSTGIIGNESYLRADSRFGPSQWETVLLCNNISHWLGTSPVSIECAAPMDTARESHMLSCGLSIVWWYIHDKYIYYAEYSHICDDDSPSTCKWWVSLNSQRSIQLSKTIHYSDVTWGLMQFISLATRLFVQYLLHANNKENIKAFITCPAPQTNGFPSQRAINSLRPSDAYVRQTNMPTLLQIMACRLLGAKPLSEPMLPYCQLNPKKHISVFEIHKFSFRLMHFKMSSAKWRPFVSASMC